MPKAKSQLLKTIISLIVAIVVMFIIRASVVTVFCVEGDALQPVFIAGERVMVNRWSYGLRIGGNRFLGYNRLWRQSVERGDIVAVNDPTDTLQQSVDDRRVLLLRCKAVPGDSIKKDNGMQHIPGRYSCADMDYYLMGDKEEILVPEDHIIGRAFIIIYSHDPSQALWDGWRTDRFFLYP